MPTTRNRNIEWEEVMEGYSYAFDTISGTTGRGGYIADGSLNKFIEDMLGYSFYSATDLIRVAPESHPRWPWLYAQKVEFSGPFGEMTGQAGGYEKFARTLFRITYQSLPYEVIPGGPVVNSKLGVVVDDHLKHYVTKTETFTVESVATPSRGFEFVDAPVADIPENPPKLMTGGEVQYTWHQIPAVQLANGDWAVPASIRSAITSCNGKVNDSLFDGRYATETLLSLAPHVEPTRMSNGKRAFDITFKWARRHGDGATWNHLWRGGTINAFRRVRRKGVGPPDVGIYETVNMNSLFLIS